MVGAPPARQKKTAPCRRDGPLAKNAPLITSVSALLRAHARRNDSASAGPACRAQLGGGLRSSAPPILGTQASGCPRYRSASGTYSSPASSFRLPSVRSVRLSATGLAEPLHSLPFARSTDCSRPLAKRDAYSTPAKGCVKTRRVKRLILAVTQDPRLRDRILAVLVRRQGRR